MAIEAPVAPDEVFHGEAKRLQFDITDADGNPFSLGGKTLVWVLQASRGATEAEIRKETDAGIVIDGGIPSRCYVTIANADWAGVDPGKHYHALVRTDPGDETVLSFGSFMVSAPRAPAAP